MNNGRVEFSELRTGTVRGYSFNLVDVGIGTPISSMEQILIDHVERTVSELERYSGRTIARIYIGKTFIPRKRAPDEGYVSFSCTNPNTWRMTGISSRWHSHQSQDHGRDGLVVLCAVTQDNVPNNSPMSQEQLALAMEQRLLHHNCLSYPDPRVVNQTFSSGQLRQYSHHAYAIYIAFSYEEGIGASSRPPPLTATPLQATHNAERSVNSQQQEAGIVYIPAQLSSLTPLLDPSQETTILVIHRLPRQQAVEGKTNLCQPISSTNSLLAQTTEPQFLPSQIPQKTTDNSVVYSQAPSTADLLTQVAHKIPTKWYEIGILLEIETSTLDSLESQSNDPVRLFIKMLDQWKREQKVPFTWDTIINTLEKASENKTATELREWLKKQQ